MKSLLYILLLLIPLNVVLAAESNNTEKEFILPKSPKQKVFTRYQRNFDYQHDRGLYLAASLGPQWNHSLQEPNAKAIRFGGKLGLGWYVADSIALIGSAWGHFLEEASLIAGGPGVAFLFDGPNLGLDISFGIGKSFNALSGEEYKEFSETVLAAQISLAKYWWLSPSSCLGVSLDTGAHGFTLSSGAIRNFGWNIGLGLSILVG